MVDTCTITYSTGSAVDDLTGVSTTTYAVRYSGPCRVQQPSGQGQVVEAGEVEPVLLRLELQLPVAGTTGIERGDRVVIDTAAHDADLVGRVFRVQDLSHKTHATSRRLSVQETT